jgi:hypothetical protein
LSQTLLAASLGMTPVHLNRLLKQPRLDEIMTMRRGCLSTTDIRKLIRIAGFDDNYLHRRARVAS